jgi:heptosyltransferase-1
MERILIVRLGAMGDVLHAIPAVVQLHELRPEAEISWLVERRWRDVLPPFVSPIEVETRKWRKAMLSSETREGLRQLRSHGQFDLAIDVQGSLKSAVLGRWVRPQLLLGPANPREWPARFIYGGMIETKAAHVIDQAREIIGAAISEELPHSRKRSDVFGLAEQSPGGEAIAVLNPGAGWPAKQWPLESFAELARQVAGRRMRVLVNVGPGEEHLGKQMVEWSGTGQVVSPSLTELIQTLLRAKLFVGGDTGPMHLAAMLGVPTVAIFGPTDPVRNGPYYERTTAVRHPQSHTSYSHSAKPDLGIAQITVDEVMKAIDRVMQ